VFLVNFPCHRIPYLLKIMKQNRLHATKYLRVKWKTSKSKSPPAKRTIPIPIAIPNPIHARQKYKNICLALQRVKSRLFFLSCTFCFRVLEHFYSTCVLCVSDICCLVCGFCGRHLYHIFFSLLYFFGWGSPIFYNIFFLASNVCVKLAGNALAAIQRFNSCMLIFMFWFQTTPPLKY